MTFQRTIFLIKSFFLLTFILSAVTPAVSAQSGRFSDELRTAWGLDIMISDGGIGVGGFYRRDFSSTISGFINLSISQAKDSREVEMVDFWTGQKEVPGKINRFLVVPLHAGIQHRIFEDKIMDNFRPFISLGLGPGLIYATPYERSFFKALGHGKGYYTIGGFAGFGAYIGSDPSNLVGVNFRYYFIPYFSGIISMIDFEKSTGPDDIHYREIKQFGGFFLTFSFGIMR